MLAFRGIALAVMLRMAASGRAISDAVRPIWVSYGPLHVALLGTQAVGGIGHGSAEAVSILKITRFWRVALPLPRCHEADIERSDKPSFALSQSDVRFDTVWAITRHPRETAEWPVTVSLRSTDHRSIGGQRIVNAFFPSPRFSDLARLRERRLR